MPETSSHSADRSDDELFSPLKVFAYTVEARAPLYRAIMRVFAEGKARYQIHFRPDQVRVELETRALGFSFADGSLEEGALERALDQLAEWGNLRRSHDTGRVATLEDFRRRHFLYQITNAGEAAERAVGAVLDALADSGSLQKVMLGAILRNLGELAAEMRGPAAPRPERLYEGLFNVHEQFRALTQNASIFLAQLHEAIDASEVHLDTFLAYKEAVIAYLDDFVRELNTLAPRIVRALGEIEATGTETMIALAAEADPSPTLEGRHDPAPRLRRQWSGVAAWFVGQPGQPPTLQRLREAAIHAVERILRVLARIHEKRFRRANRTADLLQLAAWFEDQTVVTNPHRLFQDAFGLFPARHLGALAEEDDRRLPGRTWTDAPPVELSPSLRESGRRSTIQRTAKIVDHGAARRRLRERHQQRRERDRRALARFLDRGPQALAELPLLHGEELDQLLEILGRLLATAPDSTGLRRARSRDGRLVLTLTAPDQPAEAVIRSRRGRLRLPAYTLTVESAFARFANRRRAPERAVTGPGIGEAAR